MHFDIRGHNRIHFFWQRTETSVRRGMRAENQRGRHKRHLKEVSHYLLLYRFISKYCKNTVFFCKNIKKMLCQFDLNKFWNERVGPRKQAASSKLRDTMAILTELLRVSTDVPSMKPLFRFRMWSSTNQDLLARWMKLMVGLKGYNFCHPQRLSWLFIWIKWAFSI